MSNGYSPTDKKKKGLDPISGVVTNEAISNIVGLSASGSRNVRLDIKVSGVTVVGSIAIKLRHSVNGSETFTDLAGANATIAITTNGVISLTQNVEIAADQPNMPLRKHLQVVLTTTNAGDEVTIDNVWLSQGL